MSSITGHALGNSTALQAYESGNIGLSFGGAGLLILYYVGVFKVLRQLGIVHPNTRVAGVSSGALTAGAVCSGMTEETFYGTVKDMLNTCRASGCAGRMDRAIRDLLAVRLPDDAASRCSGRFYAGVTVLEDGRPKAVMAGGPNGFKDKSDLIDTLAASAYIPIWSGRSLFTQWRGMDSADGSLSAQQMCPPGTAYCLRVASRWPDLPRPTFSDNLAAIARSLGGFQSAAAGLLKPALPASAPPAPAAKLEALQKAGLDIAPGLTVDTSGIDASTWTELGLIPCDPDTCDWLYRMGQLDTMAWAEATGIAAAALDKKKKQDAQRPPQQQQQEAGPRQGADAQKEGQAAAAAPAGKQEQAPAWKQQEEAAQRAAAAPQQQQPQQPTISQGRRLLRA